MKTPEPSPKVSFAKDVRLTHDRLPRLLIRTMVLIAIGFLAHIRAAEVTTDKLDYAPGATVYISGTGFARSEVVECEVEHSDGLDTGDGHDPWYVKADKDGSFTTSWHVNPDDSAWATLILTAIGQKSGLVATAVFTDAPPQADIDQGKNGSADAPLGSVDWVNGNLNESQSHYVEGYSIPYRLIMTSLPTDGTVITLTLAYDAKHSGAHAIDWVTHYACMDDPDHNAIFGHGPEAVDPLAGVSGVAGVTDTLAIPNPFDTIDAAKIPPYVTRSELQAAFNDSTTPECPKEITLFGGDFIADSFRYGPLDGGTVFGDLNDSQTEQQFTISFTATSDTAVLAWGGHIARVLDWGSEPDGTSRSAGGISGSPYHMRTINWTLGNLGNQDRSLSASAVVIPIDCELPDDFASCPNTVNTHTVSSPNATSYSWSFVSNTSGASFVGPTDGESVDVLSGNINGSYTVQVTATGNNADAICTQTVTVSDIDPPVITCPSDLTLQCDEPVPAATTPPVIDNCDPIPAIVFNESSSGTCPTIITRTWTATDDVGNQSICTQTITIDDTTPPVLAGCPADVTVECIGDAPAVAQVTASDNCDSNVQVNMVQTPQDLAAVDPCGGTITRVWTAVDDCGNEDTCTQVITIDDTTPPVLAGCPDDVTVECISNVPVPAEVTATDNCDNDVQVDMVQTPESLSALDPCGGTITRVWTAVDDCGNEDTCTQVITVDDTTPPVLAGCPGDMIIGCISDVPAPAEVTATDNCDSNVQVSMVQTPEDLSTLDPCGGTITRVWTAVDDCGNDVSCTQVITLIDEAPEITRFGMEHELFVTVLGDPRAPEDGDTIRVILLSVCGTAPFEWEDPEVSDDCDDPDIEWVDSDPLVETTRTGFATVYTRVITVKDACSQVQVTVEVVVAECPTTYCTLTQGGWSVPDKFAEKTAPAKTNGISRDFIVMKLFNDPACGGPRSLWIGKDTGNYVEVMSGDWKKLRLLLPSGGPAGPLPDPTMINGIVAEANELEPLLKKNGNFDNVLIGQYVALQLNVWLGDCPGAASDPEHPPMIVNNLGLLVLTPEFCTLPADLIPLLEKQLAIDPDSIPIYLEELGVYHGTVPQGVFDALDALGLGNTVNDLLELARRYLAGEDAGGVSGTSLVTALSSYNEGFDECRVLLDPVFCESAEAP